MSITLTPRTTPYLSPQAGVDNDLLGDGLAMTTANDQD